MATVTFYDWDGTELSSQSLRYNETVTVPTTPTRQHAQPNVYKYVFSGWGTEVSAVCKGNATYTATFNEEYVDYTVTFENWDGTVLSTKTYHWGDVVTAPADPTRMADNTYTYTFAGWDKNVVNCTGDAIYTATYTPTYIEYTVTFKNWDGTILSTETYHWGDIVTVPADPTRVADNTYTYTFAGWDKNIVNCAGDAIYTATYTPTYIEYTVTFKNWDGTTLSTKTYHWGDTVTAPANPTRATDTYYTYTFGGWDRQIDTVCTANATYIAQYSKVSHSKASISASADTLNRGDTFSVTAKLDNNIPVNLVTFILDFDSDVFELLGGNCLVDGTAVFQIIPEDKAGTLLLTNAAVISGDVIEFRLKVKDGAAFDTSSISVQTFIGNGKGNEIDSAGAELSVVCAHEYAPWENLDSTYKIQICTICGHEEIGYIDYIVYFIRDDGTVIAEQTYHYGQQIVPPANATKDADTYYAYTFAGWDREIAAACTANATYIAQYSKVSHSKASISASVDTLNRGDTFTVTAKLDNNIPVNLVTFILDFDSDVFELLGGNCLVDGTAVFQIIPEDKAGTLLLTNAAVISGDVIEFRLKVKDGAAFDTSGISARAFIGTDSGNEIDTAGTELAVVCKHEYAPWEKLNNTYNIRACTICGHEEFEYIDYTVVFKNWNDEIISTKTYHYGDEIEIPANPTKTADETYTYTFAGWDSEVVACAGDATYKATYTAEYIDYTVVFKDWNDEIISTKTYHYGDTIEIPANPTKAADETYTYTFAGWDNEVVACAGDATYTATYDKEYINYTVVFKNWDDTVISTQTYHYGDEIEIPANPTKVADNAYTYTFAGWDSEVSANCAGNATYKATYTAVCLYEYLVEDGEVIITDYIGSETNVTIPSTIEGLPVTTIGYGAFYNCTGLTSVVIPNSVTTIDYDAFSNCTGLTSITIPDSVTYINAEEAPFSGCTNLTGIWVSENNPAYSSDSRGVLFNKGKTVLMAAPYKISGSYTIPSSVIGFCRGAFAGRTGLTNIVIPDGVTSFNYYLFEGCTGLTSITIPGSVSYISVDAFANCTGLREVVILDGVTEISVTAFSGCTNLTSITVPDSLATIGLGAFTNCVGLTSINLPNSVTTIREGAFDGCTNLTTVIYCGTQEQWNAISIEDAMNEPLIEATLQLHNIENGVCTICGHKVPYTVTFKNWDGTVISTNTYHWGDTVIAPVNPTKQHAQANVYRYVFAGWDNEVVDCTGDATYIATYTEEYIDYTVVFKNWDGTVLSTETYHYGDAVTAPANPTKTADETYTYTFAGWDSEVSANCAGNATYKATYTEEYINYTVVFKNWNGNVLSSQTYHWGDVVTVPAEPTKAADNVGTYTFAGWDKAVATSCDGNVTYTATYTTTYINYTVVFKNWDGAVLSTKTYHWGDTVTVPANPTRPTDDTYIYTFAGWDSEVSANCAGNATYKATYTEKYIDYTVVFKNWDGTVLSTNTYHWGDAITTPANPSKAADNVGSYAFAGWDNDVVENCAGNATYTATYTTTYINYTVVFKNWDGTVLSTKTYHWGDNVTKPANPTRPTDDTYIYTFTGWDKTVASSCNGNVVYTAVYSSKTRVPSTITSSTYQVSGGTISNISIGTTVSALVGKLNEGQYVKVYNGNTEVSGSAAIGTGMVVKIMDGTTVKASVTVVVTGDTNGDGKTTVTDMLAIKSHLLKKSTLSGASGQAADTSGDNALSITDFIQMKAHILGKSTITPRSASAVALTSTTSETTPATTQPAATVVMLNNITTDAIVPTRKDYVVNL